MSDRSPNQILISIYPETVIKGGVELFYDPIAEGIVGVLTEDQEEGIQTVTMRAFNAYGLNQNEALALALNNVWARNLVPTFLPAADDKEDSRLQIIHDDEPLAATYVYRLEKFCQSRFGAFFTVPTRRHLIFHEVIDRKFVLAVSDLIKIARTLINEPSPINSEVYWRSADGQVKPVSYDIVDNEITIRFPEEFIPFIFDEIP